MTDVFISYKHRLKPKVDQIATELKALGLDVWYDAGLLTGNDYAAEISTHLRAAKCVMVCWSNDVFPHGGDRNGWVRGEAEKGRERGVLIPIMLEPTDLDAPWNTVQFSDLSNWSSDSTNRMDWRGVLRAIGNLVGRPGLAAFDEATAAGTSEALTAWAREYADDPLVPAVWEKVTELEVAATRARIEAERARPKPDVRPGPRPSVSAPRALSLPAEKLKPATDVSVPAGPERTADPGPFPKKQRASVWLSLLPLLLVGIVTCLGALGLPYLTELHQNLLGESIVVVGPAMALAAYAYAFWRGGVFTGWRAIIFIVVSLLGYGAVILMMVSGLGDWARDTFDGFTPEVVVGVIFGGLPLLIALGSLVVLSDRRADAKAWIASVAVALLGGLAIGFAATSEDLSIIHARQFFPWLAAIWQLGFLLGVLGLFGWRNRPAALSAD